MKLQIALITAVIISDVLNAASAFVYENGVKVSFTVVDDAVVIRPNPSNFVDWPSLFADYHGILTQDQIPVRINDGFYRAFLDNASQIDSSITILRNDMRIDFANLILLDNQGREVFITSRVYAKIKPEFVNQIDTLLDHFNLSSVTSHFNNPGNLVIELRDGKQYDPITLSSTLYMSGMFNSASPDYTLPFEPLLNPSDSLYPCQYYLDSLDMSIAWDCAISDATVIVAVLDGGFEDHYDIDSSHWTDGAGYVNPPEDEMPPQDCNYCYHGMAVAGIINATTNNDRGIASVAGRSGIRVLGQKIFNRYDANDPSIFASEINIGFALEDAVNAGALVINNSWGKWPNDDPEYNFQPIEDALDYADSNGVLVVCGSGKHCVLSCWEMVFPASYHTTFSVGSLDDSTGERASYSNGGPDLDVMAFGEAIWTTDRMGIKGRNQKPDGHYVNVGGTSFAVPQVSAIAALIMQRRPDLQRNLDTLKMILRYSCENPYEPVEDTARIDDQVGWGRVNAFRALLSVCRGDADNSGSINIADVGYIVNYIFNSGPEPEPHVLMGDADCTGVVNVGDAVYLIGYIQGGPAPPICFEY